MSPAASVDVDILSARNADRPHTTRTDEFASPADDSELIEQECTTRALT